MRSGEIINIFSSSLKKIICLICNALSLTLNFQYFSQFLHRILHICDIFWKCIVTVASQKVLHNQQIFCANWAKILIADENRQKCGNIVDWQHERNVQLGQFVTNRRKSYSCINGKSVWCVGLLSRSSIKRQLKRRFHPVMFSDRISVQ